MISAEKERTSNFELLRIFVMYGIICFHIVNHAAVYQLSGVPITDLFSAPEFWKRLLPYQIINTFGQIGNAIFILIAGYFLANSNKINLIKQISKIFYQLLFGVCSLTLLVFCTYFFKAHIEVASIVDKLSNIVSVNPIVSIYGTISILSINSMSWYLGYYILIVIIASVFLNKYIQKQTQQEILTCIITVGALITFYFVTATFKGITGNDFITRIFVGIFLYMVGGYIKIYNPFEKIRGIAIIFAIALAFIYISISFYNNTMSNIEKFDNGMSKTFSQTLIGLSNNSFFAIFVSILVFELFRRIKIGSSKIVNFIASGTLMIYLVHDNEYMYSFYRLIDWVTTLYYSPIKAIAMVMFCALAVFIFGFTIHLFYLLFVRIINFCILFRKHQNSM